MPELPRLPQLNVEVTQQTKTKLGRLEAELAVRKASKPEIVAVLLRQATAASITSAALEEYRSEAARERKKLAKAIKKV